MSRLLVTGGAGYVGHVLVLTCPLQRYQRLVS
jgi:nucleoside-diphosphate-sugar epimerase